jgi:hypothetical protein
VNREGYTLKRALEPRTLAQLVADYQPTCYLNSLVDGSIVVDAQQRVSSWNDISGNARHFTQSVDGQKPVLSRADNRENRYLHSGVIATGVTRFDIDTITAQSDPIGGTAAGRLTATGATSVNHGFFKLQRPLVVGDQVRQSITAKRVAGDANVRLSMFQSGAISPGTAISLTDGSVISVTTTGGGISNGSVTVIDEGGGWYRIEYTYTITTAASAPNFYVYVINSAGTTAYIAAGESIDVYAPSLQSASSDPTYTPTTDYPQYRGMGNGRRVVVFDGVDDRLSVTDFIGTEALTAFVVSRAESAGGGGNGRILENDKLIYWNTTLLRFGSNGLTTIADSATNSILPLGVSRIFTVTRTAAGVANHYINGLLSGTANQDSGAPAAATTALFLGNRQAGDRAFHGPIASVITFNKVLPDGVINEFYRAIQREFIL